jgi:arylsulfatase A-like enzyme
MKKNVDVESRKRDIHKSLASRKQGARMIIRLQSSKNTQRRLMHIWTTFTIAACAFAALLGAADYCKGAERKPAPKFNICFILADDLRPDGLHSLGNSIVKSPNLDRLVDRGLIFRNTYIVGANVGAVCTPSRTMIQTGRSYFRKERTSPTLAETIRDAGFASIRSGKFDNNPNKLDVAFDQHVNGGTGEGNVDNIMKFIREQNGEKPLFLYLAPHEPHDPQHATDEFYAMYRPQDITLPANFLPFHPFDNGEMLVRDERTLAWPRTRENVTGKLARYYASISYLDSQVARLVQALKDAGRYKNTIFIIAGDNGLSLGEHGLLGKQNLYEFGGMHVPLVFAGPGIPHGETRSFAYLYDIYPTICELCGIAVPKDLDAKSLLPIVRDPRAKVHDYVFTSYRDVQRAIRDDRWKLIRYPQIDKTQLFDLAADPHEMRDLAAAPENAAKTKELMGVLSQQQLLYGDDCPLTVKHPKDPSWSLEKFKGVPLDMPSAKPQAAKPAAG